MFNEKGNYQYPGDMVKSTYDSNNDGVVNAADSVPWSGVTNTPDTLSGYGIEDVPASVLSGVIGPEHIPPSAMERMKIVENDSMRFALTTADVQNGDTVKVTSTDKMYLVVDDGNLDSESGYMVYVAGRAAAVDWAGVENKPATVSGYGITDVYTKTEVDASLKNILGNFATIEQSTAQANHSIGELIVVEEKLRKVTSAITTGQTIGSGNSAETNVAAEFASVGILINKLMPTATAGAHNCIYRGKDITSYLTDGSLWDRIKGTNGYTLFEDLYIGDYITAGGRSYTIVDFDYYIRCGSGMDLAEHHLVMMPTGLMNIPEGTVLYNPDSQAQQETLLFINNTNASAAAGEEVTVTSQESANYFKWNATMTDPNTHSTAGGYKYSRMRTIIMRACDTLVVNDFGASHVKPLTVLYHNPGSASASGAANTWAWFNKDDWTDPLRKSICDLPNETQVYGQQVWGRGSSYTNVGYEIGLDKFQFAIFSLQRAFANIRAYWWLRSVCSASYAAGVYDGGFAVTGGSAYAYGVRPRFLLVG